MVRSFGFLLGFACLALSAPIMAADSNISDLERNALLQARLAQYITSLSAEDGGFRYLDRQDADMAERRIILPICKPIATDILE